eukprot:815888-Rhodomonas_salina.1
MEVGGAKKHRALSTPVSKFLEIEEVQSQQVQFETMLALPRTALTLLVLLCAISSSSSASTSLTVHTFEEETKGEIRCFFTRPPRSCRGVTHEHVHQVLRTLVRSLSKTRANLVSSAFCHHARCASCEAPALCVVLRLCMVVRDKLADEVAADAQLAGSAKIAKVDCT